jgi:hypothetical protein
MYRPGNEYVKLDDSVLRTCVDLHEPSANIRPTATGLADFWQSSVLANISIWTG